ncbi:hypothetical protein SAMN05720766_10799 [Fibrobacter sp. UWH9]|uniref:hypothetical protein n=1 Tax=unclassified Fibrobacter TaxID=2634177 RepID=UPI00091E5AE2|nr:MULTISPECIES: hypothetical protein [unclassified Fibrobacter]MCQ2098910.1 hypothetical protein [Fibrobacter sp.]OWV05931.1 hypothetical protein B7993_06820 [Fibrobacter sp. UWH3]OWV15256.1 hypothetical protein B7992_05645 [Fibrobacter sp. UWH1]SHH12227.1 hypothetical protein SAMN05720766_10799 [Fibrobacter sp. UWH9]SHK98235.1 hypothetical protein SAMN05720764_10651 [Fibrobacter sp. UWH5]
MRSVRFIAVIVVAVALVAVAFRMAKPLPSTNFDESFLPKASSVRYVAAGHDASVAGLFWIKGLTELGESFLTGKEYAYLGHVANLCTELDSLFNTPYYFVGGITPVDAQDTSDFVVLRRASKVYPENWRYSLYYAMRLARGPHPNKTEAANVMRRYFDSPDTTIPPHIRTIYRSFELDTMQTEMALESVLNDMMQPRFKKFREGFYSKVLRLLGYKGMVGDPEKNETYQRVKFLMNAMVEGKMHPGLVYRELLAMKKVEEPEVKTDSVEPPSDSVAVAFPDSTSN